MSSGWAWMSWRISVMPSRSSSRSSSRRAMGIVYLRLTNGRMTNGSSRIRVLIRKVMRRFAFPISEPVIHVFLEPPFRLLLHHFMGRPKPDGDRISIENVERHRGAGFDEGVPPREKWPGREGRAAKRDRHDAEPHRTVGGRFEADVIAELVAHKDVQPQPGSHHEH